MKEMPPAIPDGSGVITEWVDLLKAIPGAAKALAHLVTGAGDAGAAWIDVLKAKGEQRAQSLRNETHARSTFMQKVGKAALIKAAEDSTILNRAIAHLSADLVRGQEAREEIASLTIEHLRDEPPSEAATEAPSEDWLNLFSSLASRANSKTMREHWAQILSGEIRKPGAFSLATLQIMSLLDATLAGTIIRVWPAVVNGTYIPTVGKFNEGASYSDLVTLDSLGLLRLGHSIHMTVNADGRNFLLFKSKALIFKGTPGAKRFLRTAILTRSGKEIASIIDVQEDEGLIRNMAPLLMQEMGATAVFLTPLVGNVAYLDHAERLTGAGEI